MTDLTLSLYRAGEVFAQFDWSAQLASVMTASFLAGCLAYALFSVASGRNR